MLPPSHVLSHTQFPQVNYSLILESEEAAVTHSLLPRLLPRSCYYYQLAPLLPPPPRLRPWPA